MTVFRLLVMHVGKIRMYPGRRELFVPIIISWSDGGGPVLSLPERLVQIYKWKGLFEYGLQLIDSVRRWQTLQVLLRTLIQCAPVSEKDSVTPYKDNSE